MTSKSKSDDSVDGDFLSNNWNGDESHLGLDGDVDGYPPGGRQAKAPGVSSHHKGGPRSTGKLNIFRSRKNDTKFLLKIIFHFLFTTTPLNILTKKFLDEKHFCCSDLGDD